MRPATSWSQQGAVSSSMLKGKLYVALKIRSVGFRPSPAGIITAAACQLDKDTAWLCL